ncbi:hypothetical protein [Dactylosporangium sp. CA-233914]|uniref:hypothetical protein n=1 Tax=Dactylosporangium sp. CA-233914 TaxID=3239934 RepID=UPI003D8CE7A3
MFVLAAVAGGIVVNPAAAANYGNTVHRCYGIWWNTDWNQECQGGGAESTGHYDSTADCTAPQIPDKYVNAYRTAGSTTSYDGPDCKYGIHSVGTSFWQ